MPPRLPVAETDTERLIAWRQGFLTQLASPMFLEALFDRMPDIVFSIKDRAGRYVYISDACAERCGLSNRLEAIGCTARQLFPVEMAARYEAQDAELFSTGQPVLDNLDLTLLADGKPGWCLTNKVPLHDRYGGVIGLACLSRDLQEPSRAGMIDAPFAATVDYIHTHFAEPLRMESLAEQAGLSVAQFERRMKKVFQLSAGQFLLKCRIDAAATRLRQGREKIADIALACGFFDQSALSRQFRQLTGLSPRQYRERHGMPMKVLD
ncbi:AraC family transcriptional regulator [Chitinivorax sp. B]|uniref:AraC family transcriptional regulator n=1 Tax=Chitinivorax sp. B TaxID=2502235 RepID=UPI0010F88A97|nr:AraC family transcriptional regulator [Chitinivorax sp. B]